jgi:hypothetical protein
VNRETSEWFAHPWVDTSDASVPVTTSAPVTSAPVTRSDPTISHRFESGHLERRERS